MVQKIPTTSVTRFFTKEQIPFIPHLYKYEEQGGTKVASTSLNESEHSIIKTLVMETSNKQIFICLMHGNKQVSIKNMARFLQVPSVKMCSPQEATKATGYIFGGTSPFATKKKLPVYCEKSILDLADIWINAGKRGFLVKISTVDLQKHLKPIAVEVAIDH